MHAYGKSLTLEQMMHPKTKREFPTDVKPRVDELRRKSKASKTTALVSKEDSDGDAPTPAYVFPTLPEFNFTILKQRAETDGSLHHHGADFARSVR